MVNEKRSKNNEKGDTNPLTCGLIMPISSIDGCSSEHWMEVKSVISEAVEAIETPQFSVKLVSDADDIGVIQKRIVQNIYNSDIVVCDVSGKNPNVMFELGMRLAFDKPTVIVKDDKTDYSFDTGIIEHVPYPRDLRFSKIVSFKAQVAEKVIATYKAAQSDPSHSTFLKNFGKFQVANLEESVISADKLVLEMLSDIQSEMSRLRRAAQRDGRRPDETAGIDRIYVAVMAYRAENPGVNLQDLAGDMTFYDRIEEETDAPRFFKDPDEFRRAVDRVVLRIERSEKSR